MPEEYPRLRACFIASLGAEAVSRFVDSLGQEEAQFLLHYWPFWARDNQRAPKGDWQTWLLLGGRGCGKTRAGAEWIRAQVEGPSPLAAGMARRVALVAPTLLDAREVMIDGESGLRACSPKAFRPSFSTSRRRLKWPNGALAYIFSAEDPDSLRGPQFDRAWCDEFCSWSNVEQTWDMLRFGLRMGTAPRAIVTTTPRPIAPLLRLVNDKSVAVSRGRTAQKRHLSAAFIKAVTGRYGGTFLGRQELDGEIIEDPPGALWCRTGLKRAFDPQPPPLTRIVVAVDPPITAGRTAAACGIVVAGRVRHGDTDHVWVLADYTIQGVKPEIWAGRVMEAYADFEADRIIAEANQGGEMVRTVLHLANPDAPVGLVHAMRGKRVRAEPVAALYEQGRVHHAVPMSALEDQMCAFGAVPVVLTHSPDRVDALVWAITALIFEPQKHPRLRVL